MHEVRFCRYCSREMRCSTASYAENPFCAECLHERMAKASNPPVNWRLEGDYLVRVEQPMPMTKEELQAFLPSEELHAQLRDAGLVPEDASDVASGVRVAVVGLLRGNPSVQVESEEFLMLLATGIDEFFLITPTLARSYAESVQKNLTREAAETLRNLPLPTLKPRPDRPQ